MRGGIIYRWPRARFIERETMSTNSTPWNLTLSLYGLYRARGSDRSMSCCLVSESIIENRVRSEPGGRRRKKRKSARGGKRGGFALLETFVERCLTGTCCWCSTPTTSLLAVCTLAQPHSSSQPSFSFSRLSPVLSWHTLLRPPLHLFTRLLRASFGNEKARFVMKMVGESSKLMTSSRAILD